MTFTLRARELWFKWGFMGGDLQQEHPDKDIAYSDVDALVPVVRRFLEPLLGGIELIEFETIHNPIRAADWPGDCPEHLKEVFVEVSPDEWRQEWERIQ